MPTYTFKVYDFDASDIFGYQGDISTYTGSPPETTIEITDHGSGVDGQSLEDRSYGETATGTITINGNTSTNSLVHSDVGWTLRDTVTGNVFDLVSLHVREGAAEGWYTVSEKALVPGRNYEVVHYGDDPDGNAANDPVLNYQQFVCFATGTLISTPDGQRSVESLKEGDWVNTLEHGPRRLIWIGRRELRFDEIPHRQQPIEFKPGSLGAELPKSRLVVSPQHRIVVEIGARAEDQDQHLVIARAFTHLGGVRQMKGCRRICYHSLMTERHEVIFANGLAVESFYPGAFGLSVLSWFEQLCMRAAFAAIDKDLTRDFGPLARPELKRRALQNLHNFSCCSEAAKVQSRP